VRPGDSFWSVAAAVLQEAWGRPPTDAEIDPYWLGLIAANRRALLHPDVPDLIYAGQVFALPSPPSGGGG
jgi:nucleoid-associated protein YgaU